MCCQKIFCRRNSIKRCKMVTFCNATCRRWDKVTICRVGRDVAVHLTGREFYPRPDKYRAESIKLPSKIERRVVILIDPAVAWSTGPVGDKSVLEVRPTNAPFDCSWVRVEIRHIGPGYRPGRSPGRRRIGRFHRSQLGSRENGSIKSRSGSRGRVDRGIRTPAELPFGTVAQNRAVETGRLFELGNCRRNHAKLFGTDGGAKVDHDSPKMASDKVVLCCRAIPFSRNYRSFLLALLSPPAL